MYYPAFFNNICSEESEGSRGKRDRESNRKRAQSQLQMSPPILTIPTAVLLPHSHPHPAPTTIPCVHKPWKTERNKCYL